MTDVQGHCYCGSIRYAVRIPDGKEPIFTAYCHCDSCRRSHAAPLYHVVCVDASMFTLQAGAEHLVEFQKAGGTIVRAFCGTCGTRMLNRFPGWTPGGLTPLAFFPNTLDEGTARHLPDALRPVHNNSSDECVLDRAFLQKHL